MSVFRAKLGRRLAAVVQGLVGLAILAVLVEGFVASGLIRPVVVAGGSMAPHLVGSHRLAVCSGCGASWAIDQAAQSPDACPECGSASTQVVADGPADRLLAGHYRGLPQRWQTVLLRSPEDARQLLVKRVLGLPGEAVALADGDLWINDRRIAKSLSEQQSLWVPIARSLHGWRTEDGARLPDAMMRYNTWRCHGGRLVFANPLTDDLPYNAQVTRRVRPMFDRAVEFRLSLAEGALIEVMPQGRRDLRVRVAQEAAGKRVVGFVGRRSIGATPSSAPRTDPLVTVSTFDHQLLVAIDGKTVLTAPLEGHFLRAGSTDDRLTLVASGAITVAGLTVYRDQYLNAPAASQGTDAASLSAPIGGWQLGPEEWFVLGDNTAISRDSRNWKAGPGVPTRLLRGIVRR
ncbi:S26 family signal peptidase [Botrimarina hoheduenensis]|uniref:Signal peptidase I n=1 Tax=Botrimarina hoheduenensis TaxID=2528000 RepID=A0A5C5WCL7_9BACT|nr:S26 family signal peptidase [Botrimarina hoheduenensis]TWT47779.1 hypothetical protein Pla111_14020 [Botrimarina hoheduenensis]